MWNNYYINILRKIENKKLTVGIIGLGYVGLKLLLQFANKNYKTFGYDNDKRKIKNLKKNKSPISYISNKNISKIKKNFL